MSINNGSGSGAGADADIMAKLNLLNDAEKREIQAFVQNAAQTAQIQETVHNMTAMCFQKCVTSTIKSPQLDKYEEPCMQHCVQRFMDANLLTLKHLEKMRQS